MKGLIGRNYRKRAIHLFVIEMVFWEILWKTVCLSGFLINLKSQFSCGRKYKGERIRFATARRRHLTGIVKDLTEKCHFSHFIYKAT